MPGGSGNIGSGIGSILGGLMRGMGGQGGMGGPGGMGGSGMGGRGGMGGFSQNQDNSQQTGTGVNEYDIDRWKRADDIDQVSTPMIQAVKDDWAQDGKKVRKEHAKKLKKEKPEQYLNKTRVPDIEEIREEKARMEREPAETVYSSDMKKAVNRMAGSVVKGKQDEDAPKAEKHEDLSIGHVSTGKKNYLGLESESGIEGFFTSDPMNSLYLAVDSLSMCPLSMSQAVCGNEDIKGKHAAPEINSGKEYMEALRESREARKYDVRFVE